MKELNPPGKNELHRRLVWLTFFRLAVVCVLFASTLVLAHWPGADELPSRLEFRLLGVAGLGFLATLGFALLLRSQRWLQGIAYAEISADVVLAAMLVVLTGGSSVFSFMFILAVVNAALALFQRGAMAAAALSSIAFALVKIGLNENWIEAPVSFLAPHRDPTTTVFWTVCVNLSAFFLVAALASYAANQLRRAGEQLIARESDIRALTGLHESILASIPSGITTIDNTGRVTFVNRAGLQICQDWLSGVGEITLTQLLPGIPNEIGESPQRHEIEILVPSGPRWLGLTVSNLRPTGDEPRARVVVFQDLTELHELETAARRNEKLAAVGKLATGLAHELRNPLASMSGAVQMLPSSNRSDPDEVRLVDIVVGETERLNRLITDFLSFARPTVLHPIPVDLSALTEQTLDIIAHSPAFLQVSLNRHIDPGLWVMGDGDQLRQALWNLALNAAQAMEGRLGSVWVRVVASPGQVVLEVEDEGAGVPAKDLPRIFDPFFTTKPGGTGLGLSTVQALVEAHGGKISIQSQELHGARFSIRLNRILVDEQPPIPIPETHPQALV